jgi:hypothetical protein
LVQSTYLFLQFTLRNCRRGILVGTTQKREQLCLKI